MADVFVSDSADGALRPYDSLIDPMIMPRRIGLGFLATD
jgi:hypothetical protein